MTGAKLSDSEISRFWEGFTPQIQEVLVDAEDREIWTFTRTELPELFEGIEESLPDVVTVPPSVEQTVLFKNLISLLASVPFRDCIAALAYLEKSSLASEMDKNQVGSGTACFMIANRICLNRDGNTTAAKIVRDRVRYLVKLGFQLSMFARSADEVANHYE